MAGRHVALGAAGLIGLGASALVAALVLGTLVAVALRAEEASGIGPAEWAAIRFTLLQALMSAAVSTALAIPVARALARRRFPGRSALVAMMGAPFVLPVIVAVLGLLAVFGQGGLLNQGLTALGWPTLRIYGLKGVVLAHVFFNLPLAVRLILQGWQAIPAERLRLAASLDFSAADVARVLERPMLREVLPGIFAVIFLLCIASFAVALTLGGGPRATTVELAIYQAFRFDFDLGRAALLAVIQLGLTAVAAGLALRVSVPAAFGTGLDRPVRRWDADALLLRWQDAAILAAASIFLLAPLAMVVARGALHVAGLPVGVWVAALRSLAVALAATALALALALPMALRDGPAARAGRAPG